MKNEDMISILVPVYNVEKYIRRCILSICNQSYRNLEIILVDDGATDKSGAICDELAKQDNRIRVIHQPNGGLSQARNAGLRAANGEYIGFVDGDDFVEPDMFSYLYEHSNPDSIVACRYTHQLEPCMDQTDTPMREMDAASAIEFYFSDEVHKLTTGELQYGSFVWNKLFPRKFFQDIRFPVGKNYEDIAVFLKLYHQAQSVIFLPGRKYHYVEREDSIVAVKNIVRDDYILALQEQKKQLQDFGLYERVKDSFERVYVYVCLQMMQEIALCSDKSAYEQDKRDYHRTIQENVRKYQLSMPMKFKIKHFLIWRIPWLYCWIHYHKGK